MANLTRLTNEIQELTTVVEGATKLISELSQRIKNAGTDEAKLNELTNQLDAQANALAAAVAANTPAEDEEGDQPEGEETPS